MNIYILESRILIYITKNIIVNKLDMNIITLISMFNICYIQMIYRAMLRLHMPTQCSELIS